MQVNTPSAPPASAPKPLTVEWLGLVSYAPGWDLQKRIAAERLEGRRTDTLLLLEHRFGCLPVVGDDEQIVGIITESDFLKIAEQALRGVDVTHRTE